MLRLTVQLAKSHCHFLPVDAHSQVHITKQVHKIPSFYHIAFAPLYIVRSVLLKYTFRAYSPSIPVHTPSEQAISEPSLELGILQLSQPSPQDE